MFKQLGILAMFLAVCMTAVGCKVGPECFRPNAELPPGWKAAIDESLATQAEADQVWWTAFNDAALNTLVERARSQNLTLQEASARIWEARSQRGVVRGGLFPQVAQTDSYTRTKISNNASPFGTVGNFPAFDFWSTGFDLSWELDVFGAVRRNMEAADADIGIACENYNALQVTLLGDVAGNYVLLRTLQERETIAQENARLQAETLRITEERFGAGAVSELDVSQAKSNLHRTRAAIPQLQRERERTINRLCVLQGENPRELAEVSVGISIPRPSEKIAIGLPVNLIRQRPDIRRAEFEVCAQSARIGVAVADLYPRFSLNGSFTLNSVDIGTLFDGNSIAYRVGPGLRWNILNFGRVRSNIDVQEARFQQSVLRYRQAVLNAVEEVENALVSFQRYQETEVELREAVTAAQKAARTAEEQYKAGAISFQSLLDTQRFLAELQDRHAQARGDVTLSAVTLYKSLGGGWNLQAVQQSPVMVPPATAEPTPDNQAKQSTELPLGSLDGA